MDNKKQSVIIVTAYGEDNFYQKKHEYIVGIYTSVENAIKGAMADGMTTRQRGYLNRLNAFYCLEESLKHNNYNCFQVDYDVDYDINDDKKRTNSYMFRTFNLD